MARAQFSPTPLVLNLPLFLIGQPFRIGCLDAALEHITSHDGV